MKPKYLILILIVCRLYQPANAQPELEVARRLMKHDTALTLFKREESNKLIVAVAICRSTRMYYLFDRLGLTKDSLPMTPHDMNILLSGRFNAFDYYPIALRDTKALRNEVIRQLRCYGRVLPEYHYYHSVLTAHPELQHPDSTVVVNTIIALQREKLHDSTLMWEFNIQNPKLLPLEETYVQNGRASPGSRYQKGDTVCLINPDRFSSVHAAVLVMATGSLQLFRHDGTCIANFFTEKGQSAALTPDIFHQYLVYLEKKRQKAEADINSAKTRPYQFASQNSETDSKARAAEALLSKTDQDISMASSPDIRWFATFLKQIYQSTAENISWLKFLGITDYSPPASWDSVGTRHYELKNQVDNVMTTISDVRVPNSGSSQYFTATVVSAQDYYPFGMLQPGRQYVASGDSTYRYGFNGKENDNEVKGLGNQQDYGERPYDDRGSRFLSVDPMSRKYPWYTPYQFSGNSPIKFIDLDGLEPANNPTQPDVSEALGMKVVDGIATTAALNAIKKEGRSKEIQGSEVETGKDDFITDTDPQSAKQFNMYVNNSSVFKVDESNANKFNDYSGAVVSVLLSNFVTGKGPENVEFPVNGIISSKFLQSDILHNALKDYLAKPVGRSQQYPFGFKELTNDLKRNGTLFSMTGLVGSGMITIEPTADGIKIKIFNITSLTSGSLGKELFPQDSWPHSYVRAYKTITPYGNISQTFNLFIPNANIKKVYDSFK